MPSEVVGALVLAAVALITTLSKSLRGIITAWAASLVAKLQGDPDRVTKMWAKMQKISRLVEDLKGAINADRVSIISLHNGGLQSESGTPNYMTALPYGSVHENEVGRLNFRSVELDRPMVDTLLQLANDKQMMLDTATIEPGTFADLCISNQVQQSFLAELKNEPAGAYYYYFLWVQFRQPVLDEQRLALIRTRARALAVELATLLDTPKSK